MTEVEKKEINLDAGPDQEKSIEELKNEVQAALGEATKHYITDSLSPEARLEIKRLVDSVLDEIKEKGIIKPYVIGSAGNFTFDISPQIKVICFNDTDCTKSNVKLPKYRKKPIVIEAVQWFKNGDHPEDYAKDRVGFENGELRIFTGDYAKDQEWEGGLVRYYRNPKVHRESLCPHCKLIMHCHGWIDTPEGGHTVCPGDWIIKGVKGEFYLCKNDIFLASYEKVDD